MARGYWLDDSPVSALETPLGHGKKGHWSNERLRCLAEYQFSTTVYSSAQVGAMRCSP